MSAIRAKKYEYWSKLWRYVEEYPQILLCEANNVGSKQIQKIRKLLRGKAVMLFGKNTLIRAGLKHRLTKPSAEDPDYERRKDSWFEMDRLTELIPLLKDNVCLVFCKSEIESVMKTIETLKVPADAKSGTIAPCDVHVYPGGTGMDPSQTSFFQSLGIFTKIVKGQIEMLNEIHLIHKDKKVGNNEAVLLKKLGIRPFHFGLTIVSVYDNGSVYSAEVLKLTQDVIIKKFMKGARNISALSLQLGIPTAASVPHSILRGFKNIVSIALVKDFGFSQAEGLLEVLKDPSKLAALQAATTGPTHPAKKAKEEVKEEEPEDDNVDMGDLFGDS